MGLPHTENDGRQLRNGSSNFERGLSGGSVCGGPVPAAKSPDFVGNGDYLSLRGVEVSDEICLETGGNT
ncbi:hypothetical protein CCACVL1_18232 [Corchorus capsularis]|uniref:Uncharacterized protein n=1 Tax=Corchorus capsularis TaxID=210143 RepID=A0A1R3HMF4_COCAP|nr:hypothetical protein CCACVL1_18232 [Corchorus capsularis]